MKVYTEYQVKELLKQQRENCARVLANPGEGAAQNIENYAELVRKAEEPRSSVGLEAYFAQDMKRSFLAGFGAGYDSCTIQWNDEKEEEKLQCFDYQKDFNKWLLQYNRMKEGGSYNSHKENTMSK